MHRCRFVFNKIAQDEYAEWFYDPVDTSLYTDYLAMVQRPMCLAEIKAALESGAYDDNPYAFAEVRAIHDCWLAGWLACLLASRHSSTQLLFEPTLC